MSDVTKYFVMDNDTLVFRQPNSTFLSVLATQSSFRANGDLLVAAYTDPSRLREATVEDFDYFRVDHKGHLT
jgi:hypothetical protein